MNEIAHRQIMRAVTAMSSQSATATQSRTPAIKREVVIAVILGLLSAGLYSLLYVYDKSLITLAQDTHHGHKALFFVPIIVAFVFSLAHGSFTGRFWDVLGIKAKK